MSSKPVIELNAIYSREEAAQILGISLSTLKHLIRAGHLVVSQPPGIRRVFIRGSSILEMLDRTSRTAPVEMNARSGLFEQTLGRKPVSAWKPRSHNVAAARSEKIVHPTHTARGVVRARGGANA